jgi:DNA-binding transcriptional MerR regulator
MNRNTTDRIGAMDEELSVRDLAELAGTTVRTIHYYIAEGLLPPPHGVKRNASYTAAHLARLRLISALRDEGLALAAIRARLAPLTDEQAESVVASLDAHLAHGDRSITTLGLIEAALTREVAGELPSQDASLDDLPMSDVVEEAPVDQLYLPATRKSLHERAPQPAPAPRRMQSLSFPSPGSPTDAGAAETTSPADSASDYLSRLLHRPPDKRPLPPRPAPLPRPPRPKPDPYAALRPETWHHFEIADGIELRIRDDRYRVGRGQLRAIIDSLGPILHRYGLTQQPLDEDDT